MCLSVCHCSSLHELINRNKEEVLWFIAGRESDFYSVPWNFKSCTQHVTQDPSHTFCPIRISTSGLIHAMSRHLKYSDPLLPLRATHCRIGKLMTKGLKVKEYWKLSLTTQFLQFDTKQELVFILFTNAHAQNLMPCLKDNPYVCNWKGALCVW